MISMSDFYYVLKDKHTLPRFVVVAVGSWVITLGAVTIVLLAVWAVSASSHLDVLNVLPRWLTLALDLCGAYAGLGSICLYVTMWVYWIAVQRTPLGARVGWFFALLLLLHYGAMVYALSVWRTGIRRVHGTQPLVTS
jgi:hypothetical protein